MNAAPREIIFRVSNLIFEASVLVVALHGIRLFGPLIPLVVVAIAMAIGLVRSTRGLAATLRGEELDRPGNVLAPRGIPRSSFERLPTVLLVAVVTMMSLTMLTVLGLPGLVADRELEGDAARTIGWITWAGEGAQATQPVEFGFTPEGSEEQVLGRAMFVGRDEYRLAVGAPVQVSYVPGKPRVSRIEPPQGMRDFPHVLATAELGTVTLAGWIYLISLFIQRPRDDDSAG